MLPAPAGVDGARPGVGPSRETAVSLLEGPGSGQFPRRTMDLLGRLLEESRRRLKFRVHEETGRFWVQVIDMETQEVLKEIPPERYLDLVARIWRLVGLLVDELA